MNSTHKQASLATHHSDRLERLGQQEATNNGTTASQGSPGDDFDAISITSIEDETDCMESRIVSWLADKGVTSADPREKQWSFFREKKAKSFSSRKRRLTNTFKLSLGKKKSSLLDRRAKFKKPSLNLNKTTLSIDTTSTRSSLSIKLQNQPATQLC